MPMSAKQRDQERRSIFGLKYNEKGILMSTHTVPTQVRCSPCIIKGRIDDCSKCEGTCRKPIPMAEVQSKFRRGIKGLVRLRSEK